VEETPKTYVISFNANGGNGGQTATLTATYGELMPALTEAAPAQEGYTFTGYFDAPTGGTKYYDADLSSVANWDKTFDGYFDAQTGGTQYYNADLSPEKESWDKGADTAVLYARWISIAGKYGITLAEADYTARFAETAPVIDGNGGDPVWEKAQWKPMDQLWLSNPTTRADPSAANFTGRYKILWTAERLYFLAEITDDVLITTNAATPYVHPENDDCFELFISENASTTTRSLGTLNFFAYHISYGGINVADWVGNGYNGNGSTVTNSCLLRNFHLNYVVGHESGTTLHTWELEIKIFSDAYVEGVNAEANNIPVTLIEGKKMRFAVAYCDADSTNSRENFMGSVYVAGTDKNQAYQNAGVFANMYLVK